MSGFVRNCPPFLPVAPQGGRGEGGRGYPPFRTLLVGPNGRLADGLPLQILYVWRRGSVRPFFLAGGGAATGEPALMKYAQPCVSVAGSVRGEALTLPRSGPDPAARAAAPA